MAHSDTNQSGVSWSPCSLAAFARANSCLVRPGASKTSGRICLSAPWRREARLKSSSCAHGVSGGDVTGEMKSRLGLTLFSTRTASPARAARVSLLFPFLGPGALSERSDFRTSPSPSSRSLSAPQCFTTCEPGFRRCAPVGAGDSWTRLPMDGCGLPKADVAGSTPAGFTNLSESTTREGVGPGTHRHFPLTFYFSHGVEIPMGVTQGVHALETGYRDDRESGKLTPPSLKPGIEPPGQSESQKPDEKIYC